MDSSSLRWPLAVASLMTGKTRSPDERGLTYLITKSPRPPQCGAMSVLARVLMGRPPPCSLEELEFPPEEEEEDEEMHDDEGSEPSDPSLIRQIKPSQFGPLRLPPLPPPSSTAVVKYGTPAAAAAAGQHQLQVVEDETSSDDELAMLEHLDREERHREREPGEDPYKPIKDVHWKGAMPPSHTRMVNALEP